MKCANKCDGKMERQDMGGVHATGDYIPVYAIYTCETCQREMRWDRRGNKLTVLYEGVHVHEPAEEVDA